MTDYETFEGVTVETQPLASAGSLFSETARIALWLGVVLFGGIVFGAAILGCAPASFPPTPLPIGYVVVAHQGPNGYNPDMLAAEAAWSQATGVVFTHIDSVSGSCDDCIYVSEVTSAQSDTLCLTDLANLGCTLLLPDVINSALLTVVTDFPDAAAVKFAWKHEFGHALGLMHSAPGTLMCRSFSGASQTITPADIEQFKIIRGI